MTSTVTAELSELAPSASARSPVGIWPYFIMLLVLAGAGYSYYRLCQEPDAALGGYSAIAYSASTGEYGSASDCLSIADAERLALSRCAHPDAKIVVWSHSTWCSLAVADDRTFGTGSGRTRAEAEMAALTHCGAHTHMPCRVAVAVSSKGTESEPEPNGKTGTYAAIAYSRSTGHFGAAHGCSNLAEAELIARNGCPASDARIVIWCHGAWCALAVAEDRSFGYSWSATRSEAERLAMVHCAKYTKTPYRIAVALYGGQDQLEESFVEHAGAGPAHTVTLMQFPAVGQKLNSTRTENTFLSFNADLPNKSEVMRNAEDIETVDVALTVLEAGPNRPLKYRESFQKAESNNGGETTPLSYQGRQVTYTWTGGKYSLSFDTDTVTGKDRKALDTQANTPRLESVMSPGRAVRVGETWPVPIAELAKALGKSIRIDESASRAVCRLTKVYEKQGKTFGVIRISCDLALVRIAEFQFDPPNRTWLDGDLDTAIDGSTPAGLFTQNSTTRGPAKLGVKGLQIEGTALMTYKSNEDRRLAE